MPGRLSAPSRLWSRTSIRLRVRWIQVDPHLRGHVTPRTLGRLQRSGYRVHRVGAAAHVHDSSGRARWIVGVWAPRDRRPAWSARLDQHHRWLIGRGEPTPLEARRAAAWLDRRRRQRLRAPSGRFAGAVPWWADVDPAGRLLTPRSEQPWRLT